MARAKAKGSGGWCSRVALVGLGVQLPALASAEEPVVGPLRADMLSAGGLSIVLAALTVFAATTSVFYIRER